MKNNVININKKEPEIRYLQKFSLSKTVIGVCLTIFAFIQIYPLLFLIFLSFKNNNEIYSGNVMGLPLALRWENYKFAIVDANVALYFVNSVFVTAVTIIVSGILACMVAYALTRMKIKINRYVQTVFLMGLMVPLHAVLLPIFIVLKNLKLINSYQALIIPYIAFALPMAIFIMLGFFKTLPKEMEESAFIDGCGIYRTFFQIILPLVRPAIATISIFTFLSTWNEMMFAITFISKKDFCTLTVGIMQMVGQYTTNWGALGAGLVVATIPTIVLYILLSDQVQSGFTAGAIKG